MKLSPNLILGEEEGFIEEEFGNPLMRAHSTDRVGNFGRYSGNSLKVFWVLQFPPHFGFCAPILASSLIYISKEDKFRMVSMPIEDKN